MIANYHTHTWRCHHAQGTEREYVEQAIAGGLQILGFSDHTPMIYDAGYVSPVKMSFDQLDGYVDAVMTLKQEYARDISIFLGLEVEYYPKYFDTLLDRFQGYPIDYFLLGQHYLNNEIGEEYNAYPTTKAQHLIRYCDQCIEAMETGRFTYLAHPDLLNYVGDQVFYQEQMLRLCQAAKQLNIPLEINLLGLREHRNYPNEMFWKLAGQVGNQVVLGSDAHLPYDVYDDATIREAEKWVRRDHLRMIDTVDLKNPL